MCKRGGGYARLGTTGFILVCFITVSFFHPICGYGFFLKKICHKSLLKTYCWKLVELKKWELLEVIKRCPKPFPQFPLFAKIRFSPFVSMLLATLHFTIWWHHKRHTLDQYWSPRFTGSSTSSSIFRFDYRLLYTHCYHTVIAFVSLREFLQKFCLLWCHKFAKCRAAIGTESNGLNLIFENKGNEKKGLGHLFITSSSSHFFNKTDFEQYLFKRAVRTFPIWKFHCETNVIVLITKWLMVSTPGPRQLTAANWLWTNWPPTNPYVGGSLFAAEL